MLFGFSDFEKEQTKFAYKRDTTQQEKFATDNG